MQLLQTWIASSLPDLTILPRSISKMLAALVTLKLRLNPVGMLCFNQPIARNLPPFVPSILRSPCHWQSQESSRPVVWLLPALPHHRLASMSQLPAPASGCLCKCNTAVITAAARSGQQDQPKPYKKSSRIYLDR
jgi:hypothetical protein